MKNLLEDKIALVTGGASGIGRGTALVFAREGAKVVIADLAAEGGEETVRSIKEAGGDAAYVKCDVSQASDVEALVKKTVDMYGRLDCAFNNAGVGPFGTTTDCSEEDWDITINVNLKGVWLCMKYEIQHMLSQGGGVIVNTASVGGLIGTPGIAAYTASKHGVIGLTKTAALEYVQAGIRVNAVCPGTVLTPLVERGLAANPAMKDALLSKHPIGRFGKTEEIAEAVVWLCSDAASYVTGIAFPVDGGVVAQ
jgi:NAD(P)-dependent dehydrogenase (short-subunit alcohol dehydrogenase family)